MSTDCHSLLIAVCLPMDHKATKHNKRERIVSPWSDVISLQYGNAVKLIPFFFSSIMEVVIKHFKLIVYQKLETISIPIILHRNDQIHISFFSSHISTDRHVICVQMSRIF